MAREKLSILLSLTENTTEFHRTFVDLLSQMHLLTNKWLIKANLIKVSVRYYSNDGLIRLLGITTFRCISSFVLQHYTADQARIRPAHRRYVSNK